MIIEYETDCWKCSEMHPMSANSPQELWDQVTGMGSWLPTIQITAIENIGGEGGPNSPENPGPLILPIIETLKKASERTESNV